MADTYARSPRTLWRVAHDRVIVRRAGTLDLPAMESDLTGAAAVVWLALAIPQGDDALRAALTDAGSDAADAALREALALLAEHGLTHEPSGTADR